MDRLPCALLIVSLSLVACADHVDDTASRTIVDESDSAASLPDANSPSDATPVSSWQAVSTTNAPSPRYGHTAVWTGTEMIIWGGVTAPGADSYTGQTTATGGRYNPKTDTWTTVQLQGSPSPRFNHTAVWTGSKMFIWGGNDGQSGRLQTGALYDPATDTWNEISQIDSPVGRWSAKSVFTGTSIIIWGGDDSGDFYGAGGLYSPTTDTWKLMSETDEPTPRFDHSMVWTGNELLVWGGNDAGYASDGALFDPAHDAWSVLAQSNPPAGRNRHSTIWTGTEMVVWGGLSASGEEASGSAFVLSSKAWTSLPQTGAPIARCDHTAVWTGTEMVVWGGKISACEDPQSGQTTATGGRYDLAISTWQATPTLNSPSARHFHAAVWTGTEMIIWGGADADQPLGNGARLSL